MTITLSKGACPLLHLFRCAQTWIHFTDILRCVVRVFGIIYRRPWQVDRAQSVCERLHKWWRGIWASVVFASVMPGKALNSVALHHCLTLKRSFLPVASLSTFSLSFLEKKKKKIIYLTVPGLYCNTWDLWLHCTGSLQHVGSSSLPRDRPPGPLHWEHRVLTAGPPYLSSLSSFSPQKMLMLACLLSSEHHC